MKKNIWIPALATALLTTSGCVIVKSDGGDGDRVTRTAEPEEFSSISIERAFKFVDVEVCSDCEYQVEVQGDPAQVDDVVIATDDGQLELSAPSRLVFTSTDLTATITTPQLDELINSGSANVDVIGVQTEVFEIVSSGSGDLSIEGIVSVADIVSSGSGDIDAFDLQADTVEINSSGSGDTDVCARELLRGNLTGSGNLVYDCSPDDTDVRVVGSGDVSLR